MCIAILSPKGTQITAQQFRNSWDNNFHGAGFMYNDDQDKLHVVKEMEDCDKIYKKYVAANKKYPNATFVIHFRISNRGVISRENCHPFKVNNQLGFVHNGTVVPMGKNDRYSDTNMFNKHILRKLPQVDIKYLRNKAIQQVLGEFVGNSKLVFLDNEGNATIIKEHKGSWGEDGMWYSNDSHKRVKNEVDMGGKKVSRDELAKMQGSSRSTGIANNYRNNRNWAWNGSETGIGYKSNARFDENSEDYGRLNGNTYDLHRADDRTIGDLKARVGKSSPSTVGVGYEVSNGGKTCSCCGTHTVAGELLSEDGECMECVTQEEAANIAAMAVNDGGIVQYFADGSIVVDQSMIEEAYDEEEEDEIVECDGCLEIVYESQLTKVEGWNTCLCPKCLSSSVEQGFLDAEDYPQVNVKNKDAMELLFPQNLEY
jgi:hypothetical protein